ncbi:MAG: restriction endonuclease subunit S [Hyphomonas sp.]|uniref:restriction endonuclease subunit S n=1 Tax=Hyphomonas sp. TaxID=87 RepID=UPI0030019945
MSDLPEGWVETTFDELSDIQLGKMLDKRKNVGEPVPYLRNINVRWGAFDVDDIFSMRMTPEERKKYSIEAGDLIVCEGGEPGRAAIWREQECQFAFQKALMRVRSNGAAMPDWMYAFLIYASASGNLSERFTGTTIKHLPQRALASTPIPLPPLAEQGRIVEKLDALSAQSAAASAALTRIETLITRYKAAVLGAIFDDVVLGHKTDEGVSIGEIAASVFDGPFGSNLKSADYSDEGQRVVRLENVGHLEFLGDKRTFIPQGKFESLTRHELHPGDIIFSSFIADQIRVCRLPDLDGERAINKADCFCIRVEAERALSRFVELLLASPASYRSLEQLVHGATRPRINTKQLKALRIALPPLEEQAEIVARIEAAFAQIETLARAAAAARARLSALDRAILARAFQGKLVPQNPNDEPASEPLERVRAAR